MNGLLRSLVLLVAVFGADASLAQKRQQANPRPADAPPADSVRRAERQAGGEVIRAEPMQRDGREVYRMKVLTADGRVRVVQDDPQASEPQDRRASQDRRDPRDRRPQPNRVDEGREESSDPF